MTDYIDRKVAGKCTRPGCPRPAEDDCQLCARHRRKARAALQRSQQKRRELNRAKKLCADCGRKSTEYRCPTCKVKHEMQRPRKPTGENPGENQSASIAERTSVDKDGRTRYHGQGKRGQQPRAQLDEQDLDNAITALKKAKAGLAIARSSATAEMPRVQRLEAERAALSQADHGARFIDEVLDRNRYDEQMPATVRKGRG